MSYTDYINRNISTSPSTESKIRSTVEYPTAYDKHDEFFLNIDDRKYNSQFYSMYQYRLSTLKSRVDENALNKWGNNTKKVDGQKIIHKEKILDISSGQLCWVSGTIFSDMNNKLNILQDVEKGTDDVLPKIPDSYTNGNELPVVMLEDESGRAILNNDEFLKKNILVTGCIIAILGIEIQAGIFEIMDVVYPTLSPQKSLILPSPPSQTNSTYGNKIAFISGLGIESEVNYDLKIELLKQYLSGELGGTIDQTKSTKISELIIVGNSVASIKEIDNSLQDDEFVTTNNYGSKNISKFNSESVQELNKLITDLLPTIPISLMPGNTDPAEICLPQQTLHPSLFQNNKQYFGGPSFKKLTNPSWIEVNNIRMLGTSGQNIEDFLRYLPSDLVEEEGIILKLMESNIKWQNIIPTAPDTLYCYPYENYDPFILNNETPNVYFVGNQDKFETKTIELERDHHEEAKENIRVKLLSIPKFSKTGEIVLMDLDTLETEVIKISI